MRIRQRQFFTVSSRRTREGLAGIDFGGKDVNVPDSVLNDTNDPGD